MGGVGSRASKAPVMNVCTVLAAELSGKGLLVYAIAPCPIKTGSKFSCAILMPEYDFVPTRKVYLSAYRGRPQHSGATHSGAGARGRP